MRYMVFVYNDYQPKGGSNDLKMSTNDLEKAMKICSDNNTRKISSHIYDTKSQSIITHRIAKINTTEKIS